MKKIEIEENICKGCGLCVRACPKSTLALLGKRRNAKGYAIVEQIDSDSCISCRSCALTCPDVCITVYKS